jgi:hypothetical protein
MKVRRSFWLCICVVLSPAVFAGQFNITGGPGVNVRRLFSVCDSQDAKCEGGKCKFTLTKLTCESTPAEMKGNCTFACNGAQHILTDEQALAVFKALSPQKKMIEKTGTTEAFKDASITCEPMVAMDAAKCSVKHSKIK